jgi:hypothetical protein
VDEDSQLVVPPSFLALYVAPGRIRPSASREHILARYDLCEDMAQMLTEHARSTLFALDITEDLVLERIRRGLLEDAALVSAAEADWVTGRLAELLGWAPPGPTGGEAAD